MRDWRFWPLLGLFWLLLGLHLLTPGLDSDQAVTGLMGMHVLRGEFPTFFWSQDHAGVPEAYAAAVTLFLFGVSRWALNLVPAVAAVALVLAVYQTAVVLFGRSAALLALLFATVVSPYVAAHYVVARAYYVEQLLTGQLVLLGATLWLARPLTEPARARALIAMGLAGGVGLYCGFQILPTLAAAALALLVADPWLPLRRQAWLGLGAFLLGSAPFWTYNLVHDWATFATAARFEGQDSAEQAARVLLINLLTVLGVASQHSAAPYVPWSWVLMSVPAIAGAAVTLLACRVARGWRALRNTPALAGEAMLVTAILLSLGVVWYGRYLSAPRYLVPLAPTLVLVLARATQLVWRRAPTLAAAGAAVYLGIVGIGLVADVNALWPASRAVYWTARAEDEALLAFLRERGLHRVYSPDYWLAPRLTFDAREEVVVAQPFGDRYPAYTRAVDAWPRPAYVLRAGAGLFLRQLDEFGTRAERMRIGRYSVIWRFTPPLPVVPLSRDAWTIRASHGHGEPASLADGLLESGWSSTSAEPGWVEVDLGATRAVAGLTVIAPGSEPVPAVLQVFIADRADPTPVARRERRKFTLTWRNGAPRLASPQVFTVHFPPTEAQRLRLETGGPLTAFHVGELFVLGPAGAPAPSAPALDDAAGLEAAGALREALFRNHAAMRAAPDDPAGYVGFTRLARELGVTDGTAVERAARYVQLGLADEARAAYASAAAALGPRVAHAELAERQRALALTRGDVGAARGFETVREVVLTPRRRVGAVLGGLVELVGYDLEPERVRPGDTLQITYHWRLRAPPGTALVADVQLQGHRRIRLADDHPLPAPVGGLGDGSQHVLERRRVLIPGDAEPGRYRLVLGVREPTSGRRLRRWAGGVIPTGSRTVELGPVEVFLRS